jgi:hypothetical protein
MVQNLIVAVIVVLAAWAVARRYLPKTLRQRAAGFTARVARGSGMARMANWLEADLPADSSCGSGCGTCGNCGTGDAKAAPMNEFSISPEALKRTIRSKPPG